MTYCGATALLAPSAAFALGAGWAYQPKLDGCYAKATTDDLGRLSSVTSRTGRELPEARELLGLLAGPPRSTFAGELDAHTEAGEALHRAQGFRCLRLFDCLALDGADVRRLPYVERWGALHRGQSTLEAAGHRDNWTRDARRRRHDPAGRYVSTPTDLRRFPIVPLLRSPADARELWRDVEAGTLEGLVAVRLDARAGAKGSKLKVKITDTLDVRVVAARPGCLTVATRAGTTQQAWRDRPTFAVQSRGAERVGSTLEIAHHGYYASGEPRFARIVRERSDK